MYATGKRRIHSQLPCQVDGKIRLCHYSANDQERFVRAQLLKGMSNRELARTARTFGHETNFIVQSATRDEAFQMEEARNKTTQDVMINQVRRQLPSAPFKRRGGQDSSFGHRNKQQRLNISYPNSRRDRCSRCNRWAHWNRPCPALKLKCNTCGSTGHFAAACRQNRINIIQDNPEQQEVTVETKLEELNALSLEDVLIDCRLGSTVIKFLDDSGADVNVIGGADWSNLRKYYDAGLTKLTPTIVEKGRGLQAYATSVPKIIDFSFRAEIESAASSITADFMVVQKGKRSLLGRSTASDLKLLFIGSQINDCRETQVDIFPKMPGVSVKFSVDTSVPPTKNAYYNIPAAYREGARHRLQEMQDSGIIVRVTTAPGRIANVIPNPGSGYLLI
ncbi:uncharacterized protein LOC134209092 [Armigeres subalbatus]|uniref:uncharacterized protein LOC134209092 n=1 Tax=Armigeres subalbatus TaxID=124917 RepID=UPI002ED2404F